MKFIDERYSTAASEPVPVEYTEDVVDTLVNYFLGPVLPNSQARHRRPSESLVAKQMQAVVLLYNYYHRKQFPHLKFLDFQSFCQLAVIVKPSVFAYLKFMRKHNDELKNLEKQLSITEKAIMEACNISENASSNVPNMEGRAVSRVAVFLTHSMEKNCFLLLDLITQGVWSLIEKKLDNCINESEVMSSMNSKKRTCDKLSGDQLNADEYGLRKLAFSAVKETTGIDEKDLEILESHFVDLLSEEQMASRFYIMKCIKPVSEDVFQVSIEDAINSLTGPLVLKTLDRCTISKVVEYFHLLPYGAVLSNWLSGRFADVKKKIVSTTSGTVAQKENVGSECVDMHMATQGIVPGDRVSKKMKCSSENDLNVGPRSEDTRVEAQDIILGDHGCQKVMSCFTNDLISVENDLDTVTVKENVIPRCEDVLLATQDIAPADHVSKKKKLLKDKANEVASFMEPHDNDVCNIALSAQDGSSRRYQPPPFKSNHWNSDGIEAINSSKGNRLSLAASRLLQKKRDALSHQQRNLEDELAYCEQKLQALLSVVGGEKGPSLEIDIIIEACNDQLIIGTSTQTHREKHSYSGEQHLPQDMKRKKLSEAILNLRSSCQELDDICSENNWNLPRYNVFPANGRFRANVAVQGMDFEYSADGEHRGDPLEARESAASCMLNKLRSMASSILG